MASFSDNLELGEIIILLALIGGIIYAIYYFVENGFCNLLGTDFPGCSDPCSGQGAGAMCIDGNGNFQANPESYTSAAVTSIEHPIDTLKSIFGIN